MILKLKGDKGAFSYLFASEIEAWNTYAEGRGYRVEITTKSGNFYVFYEGKEIQQGFVQRMINPAKRREEGVINMYLDKKEPVELSSDHGSNKI